MVIKETRSDRIFNFFNYLILGIIFVVCLYPLWFIVIASVSDPNQVNLGQVWLWPKGFSLDGYKHLLADDSVLRGYLNTILYTTCGTAVNLAVTLPAAYALSRKDFVGRKFFTVMFTITMFFSGGLIPTFLTVRNLGLYNSPLVMVIMGATSMTNIIISRSFFENTIPNELRDAAEIDGCSNSRFFFRIVLPLSKAVIATMVLFYSVQYWNDWFAAFLYLDRTDLFPVTLFLRNLIAGASTAASEGAAASGSTVSDINANIQSVTMILILIPILCVYPFVQRYFVSGIMLGSVKG